MQNILVLTQIQAALKDKRATLEIFGEDHPEGIRVRKACFCSDTGQSLEDQVYSIAFLDIEEMRYRAEKGIEKLTEGLEALDTFVKGLGRAEMIGDGVKGLKQKDIDKILASLREQLPQLVPDLVVK